jgi:predicted O-methyltransferase YrrM
MKMPDSRAAAYHPLQTLLDLYESRPDLQEAFVEASSGEHTRLINWAASVSSGQVEDSSKSVLLPYAEWYNSHVGAYTPPIAWESIIAADNASGSRLEQTLEVMKSRDSQDISFHLPMLALLIREFNLQSIVELGTRHGISTVALLEAARHTGGRVLSLDIDPCVEAKHRVEDAGLGAAWTFVHCSDVDFPDQDIPDQIDLLFVDTSHRYTHTKQELLKFGSRVRRNGWIVLHDYVSFEGVARAVNEYMAALPSSAHFYPFVHQNGLAVLRLT